MTPISPKELSYALDEGSIFEKCLNHPKYLEFFLTEFNEHLNKVDWQYFIIVIVDAIESLHTQQLLNIKKNLEIFYHAIRNNKIYLKFNDLKDFHCFAQQMKGNDYYKPLLKHFPEIKGYAFKLYRKNIIGF